MSLPTVSAYIGRRSGRRACAVRGSHRECGATCTQSGAPCPPGPLNLYGTDVDQRGRVAVIRRIEHDDVARAGVGARQAERELVGLAPGVDEIADRERRPAACRRVARRTARRRRAGIGCWCSRRASARSRLSRRADARGRRAGRCCRRRGSGGRRRRRGTASSPGPPSRDRDNRCCTFFPSRSWRRSWSPPSAPPSRDAAR